MARERRVAGKDEKGGLGPSAPGPNEDPATVTKDASATPKAAARKKAPAKAANPDQLAADIERTREELAETLDAIAEKVSPKRVAKRTTKKVADAVKETAHDAADAVKETAHTAKDKVTGSSSGSSLAKGGTDWAPDPGAGEVTAPTIVRDLPQAGGVEVPSLPTTTYVAPAVTSPTYTSSGSVVKPQYIAAGAAAALLAWLLVRKRR
jgi:hypothetical protein